MTPITDLLPAAFDSYGWVILPCSREPDSRADEDVPLESCRHTLGLVISLVLLVPAHLLSPGNASAQPIRNRVLQGLQIGRRDGNWEVRIDFTVPVRYLRHSPRDQGEIIYIQLRPLQVARSDAPTIAMRESLTRPRGSQVPLVEVTYDGNAPGGPQLEVHLARSLPFEVREGKDLRSLVIALPEDGQLHRSGGATLPSPGRAAEAEAEAEDLPPAADETPDQRAARWTRMARQAMTTGDFERAVLILTKVAELPENPSTRDALELLGVARERSGQLAHAVAEYDAYLRRYPEGEASDRVRQRLAALLTRREPAPERLAEPPPESAPLDLDVWGSLYTAYRRAVSITDPEGSTVLDSSLFTDVHMGGRWRTHGYTLRSQMSGGYRLEFQDGTSDETRIDRLFVEATHDARHATLSLGRRSSSQGGVLGRYDGTRLSYRLGESFGLAGVAGFPVDSSNSNSIDTDRYFAGLSLEAFGLFGGLDGEIYAINQMLHGSTDRRAVGAELRYFRSEYFVAGLIDYDIHFTSLNTAQLFGNWQATDTTFLNALFDYRKVPTLTTYNALQGSPFRTYGELRDAFTNDQIQAMAEDRTGHSLTFSLNLSQELMEHLQLGLDFSASDLSGTDPTEDQNGVEIVFGTDGTGWEFSYLAQLVASRLWSPADSTVFGVRYFDGDHADALLGSLDGRYPIAWGIRANPRLRVQYRMDERAPNFVALQPSLRLDWQIGNYTLEAEGGGGWVSRPSSSDVGDEWDYWMIFGIRHDF